MIWLGEQLVSDGKLCPSNISGVVLFGFSSLVWCQLLSFFEFLVMMFVTHCYIFLSSEYYQFLSFFVSQTCWDKWEIIRAWKN